MKLSFRNRQFGPLLLLCGMLAVVWLRHHPRPAVAAETESMLKVEQVEDLFPEASSLVPAGQGGTEYSVLDAEGSTLGTAVVSGSETRRISGFGGPTPLAVGVNTEGRVLGVVLLSNSEDESYLQDVIDTGLLEKWNGLSPEEAAGRDVDAVSGATMSSSSIIDTLRATLRPLVQEEQAVSPAARVTGSTVAVWLVLALDLALFLAPKRLHKLRLWLLAANVGVIGFFAGQMLSLSQIRGWVMHGVSAQMWLTTGAMAVLALLLPLLTGHDFYCTHVCPYGSCQELVGHLRRKSARMPGWLGSWFRTLRGGILAVAWAGVLAGGALTLHAVEPFAAFQVRAASGQVLVLAGVFLVAALVVPRGWCRYLCPTGRLLTIARCAAVREDGKRGALLNMRTLCVALLAGGGGWLAWTASYLPPERPDDVISVIHARRSVRDYTDKALTEGELDQLVRAGMAAPTAGDRRPWSFVVVTERERLDELSEELEYGDALSRAAAGIVVCGMSSEALPGEAEGMWVLDCSAASENILLAAQGMGLGAVWVGVYPIQERIEAVRKTLGLPDGVVPLNVISLGHPAGETSPKRKYDASRLHREVWGAESGE